MTNTKKTIAAYLRLSGEDRMTESQSESNSIANQRQLILDFIRSDDSLSQCEVREFVDDGISGTRFDRASFQEMMEQAKHGRIHIIITKDYSRLGRDYLEVGKYMECLFPLLHVRYIAVNEHYDSDNYIGKTGGLDVGIKNVINMMYSRDASNKVLAARKVLTEQGKFIGSFPPYGYRKSPEDKHKLVPEPEEAEVVKKIFALAAEGKKYKEIARILNSMGVETITERRKRQKRAHKEDAIIQISQWSSTTIMDMLYNEVYIGTIVNNRVALNWRTNYKMKRRNPEEWVCVENCHEPIVSRELFEEAHRKINRRQYARHKKTSEKRKKLCICGCCGHVLEKIHGRYKCPSNLNPEKLNCRKVRMDAELFENTVLDYIRVTSESFLENLSVSQKKIAKGQDDAGEPENIRRQIKNLKTKRFQAYDDYTREKLSREEMQTIRATLLAEINDLKEMLTVREHEIEIAEASSSNVGEEELKTLAELPVFDEAAISELVKKIILYDDGNIEIIWNTDDFLQTV